MINRWRRRRAERGLQPAKRQHTGDGDGWHHQPDQAKAEAASGY
jgi:hypothetical protein